MFYLRRHVIDVLLVSISSVVVLSWEVIEVLSLRPGGAPQVGRGVVHLFRRRAGHTLVPEDGGRDVVHVLWNGRLVVVVIEVQGGGDVLLDFGEVRRHVVGLLPAGRGTGGVLTDGRRQTISLKEETRWKEKKTKKGLVINHQHQFNCCGNSLL